MTCTVRSTPTGRTTASSRPTWTRGGLPGTAGFSRFNEFSGDLGGPIVRDKSWFYFAMMDQYAGKLEAGFTDKTGTPAVAYTKLENPTLKLTHQLNDTQKLDFMMEMGRKFQPFRHSFSAAQFIQAESTQIQDSWSGIGKLSWQWIASPTTTVDAQLSRWGWWWPSTSHIEEISERDIESGYVRGGYSGTGSGSSQGTPSYSQPIRWQWDLNMNHFASFGNQTHEIKAGYRGWDYTQSSETRGTVNDQIYYYDTPGCGARDCSFQVPNYVLVYDSPNREVNDQTHTAIFFNDSWKITPKFTLNMGARYARYQTSYPEQGNSGIGRFATASVIPTAAFKPTNHLAPRFSFVYDITGQGTVALKASYGRYYNDSGLNPASTANPSATQRWRYTWDGTIPYVPNPADLIRQEAGGVSTAIDSDLKNDYTDEFTGSLEFQLTNDYSARLTFVRKFDKDFQQTVNSALPYEAFTDSVAQTDIGADNIAGTSDDRQIVIWSVPRSNPAFGTNNRLRTNLPGALSNYSSVEASLNKRFADNWMMLVSFNRDFRDTRNSMPTNPNQDLYEDDRGFYTWGFKLMSTVKLPYGINFAPVWKSQKGEAFDRSVRLRDANNSTQTLVVGKDGDTSNGGGFYDNVHMLDFRLSKVIQINDRHSVEAMFDYFNVTNANTVIDQTTRIGSTYLRPNEVLGPRIFRFGARWKF